VQNAGAKKCSIASNCACAAFCCLDFHVVAPFLWEDAASSVLMAEALSSRAKNMILHI
jgi:hypothetical protein